MATWKVGVTNDRDCKIGLPLPTNVALCLGAKRDAVRRASLHLEIIVEREGDKASQRSIVFHNNNGDVTVTIW
eukprot:scaffold3084_cov144-Cylindrotheca_fusiformis.AAC.59